MQNRYVGDIGDYLKLGILRALSPGYHLGVAWWLFPDEAHNRDGRHIGYLDRPDLWRRFDPALFDTLRSIVSSGRRNVGELEAADVLPGATFASEFIPAGGPMPSASRHDGNGWRPCGGNWNERTCCFSIPTMDWNLRAFAPRQPNLARAS